MLRGNLLLVIGYLALKLVIRLRLRSGFKTPDQAQEQGVLRVESGAYTLVREHFNPRDNAAIGP